MPKRSDTSLSTYTTMMRVTSQGRPYTKDLYDIFAAVLLQIKLTDHRVLFRTYPYSFTTDEASKVMSSLKFTHIHRQPDPKDSTVLVATKTTTTFSMDNSTAKKLMQHFLSARLIMSSADLNNWNLKDKGIYCPTLKGKYVLEEFAEYTQVDMTDNLKSAFNVPYMSTGINNTGIKLITLDRLTENDDKITFSRPNMTTAFKAMMAHLPTDALLPDDVSGIDKKNLSRYKHTFIGSHCVDWLCDRLTVGSIEEAEMVASEFVLFGWIAQVLDKSDKMLAVKDDTMNFRSSRYAIYYITERGCFILGWKAVSIHDNSSGTSISQNYSDLSLVSEGSSNSKKPPRINKSIKSFEEDIDDESVRISSSLAESSENYSYRENEISSAANSLRRSDSVKAKPVPTLDSKETSSHIYDDSDLCSELSDLHLKKTPSMSLTESTLSSDSVHSIATSYVNYGTKDVSQWSRLVHILETPLLRMYFRDFLRSNYCVENMNFWLDHAKLQKNLNKEVKNSKTVIDNLSECYSIYVTYLDPNATSDVNIDHILRQEIVNYVSTVFVILGQLPGKHNNLPYFVHSVPQSEVSNHPIKNTKLCPRLLLLPPQSNSCKQKIILIRGVTPERCLFKILRLYDRVNSHVCRMMAEDSIPKFIKTQKYKDLMAYQEQQQKGTPIDTLDLSENKNDFLSVQPIQRMSIEDQPYDTPTAHRYRPLLPRDPVCKP
ncbi:regulator of G protein signaling domain-containing protein [Pilobolus umbonatus]|nr:regulator of G protein signaling domain-containing protein [Pilobolus umbonatus]